MDKGRYIIPSDNGDNGIDREEENLDTDKQMNDLADRNIENLINNEILNIDTMREDNNLVKMDVKENINENLNLNEQNGEAAKEETDLTKEKPFSVKDTIIGFIKNLDNAWNGYIDLSRDNFVYPILTIIGVLIYLEIITHSLIYHCIDIKIIYPILFAIPLGILMGFITGLFHPVVNKILLLVFTGVICLIFCVQYIYFYIFKVFFSFQSLGMAGDAVTGFTSDIIVAIKANLFGILLIFLPFVFVAFLFNRYIDYSRRGIKLQVILLGSAVVFHGVALIALLLFGRSDYSPYDLYHKSQVPDLCGKELGITTMTRIDIGNLFGGNEKLVLADTMALQTEPITTPASVHTQVPTTNDKMQIVTPPAVTLTPTPVPIDTLPQIINIDFNTLAKNETNNTIKTLHEYFASAVPTNKNKYTGRFKGYNLILITAEGFSPYAVNKEKTPTLYKLVREGFVFNNFYTALWQTSTSDGEYVALTGLIPTGTRNMYNGRNNLWPFALGNQFDKLGVASKAYHDHTYTYYQRNETHPNLGYIFKAKGNGLVLENPDIWPESDVEMINSTVYEYVKEDQFHVYYLTVSGHMNYTFNGNYISYKNRALVADLSYSDDVKAYIACQMELDKALEQLIKKLEAAGVADRTVIALSADHYPYAWAKSILNEAAGHEVDPNFEIYKNHFILWCEGMKKNIVIDEPCSSLDILPTLSNLFGLEYDSRLLMGQDILSDAAPLVILSNRSFITDKVMYNSATGEVTNTSGEELPEDYISNLNKIIKNKFTVSETMLKEDYYRYLFKTNKLQ